jgi:hypothetical protein
MTEKVSADFPNNYDKNSRIKETREKISNYLKNSLALNEGKRVSNHVYRMPAEVKIDSKSSLTNSTKLEANFEQIEFVRRNIQNLTEKIKNLKLQHQNRIYKSIDADISDLFTKLDEIDVKQEPKIRETRRHLLKSVHELYENLKLTNQCKKTDCVICDTGIDNNMK